MIQNQIFSHARREGNLILYPFSAIPTSAIAETMQRRGKPNYPNPRSSKRDFPVIPTREIAGIDLSKIDRANRIGTACAHTHTKTEMRARGERNDRAPI